MRGGCFSKSRATCRMSRRTAASSLWSRSSSANRRCPVDNTQLSSLHVTDHRALRGEHAYPRPVQQPVPVVIGGHSRAAHRRAVTYADEWFGFMLGLRATAEQLRALEAVTLDLKRDEPLRISVSPARRLNPEVVCSFADLGVHRLVVAPPPRLTLLELERFVERHAPER